jgi:hypothetical protein
MLEQFKQPEQRQARGGQDKKRQEYLEARMRNANNPQMVKILDQLWEQRQANSQTTETQNTNPYYINSLSSYNGAVVAGLFGFIGKAILGASDVLLNQDDYEAEHQRKVRALINSNNGCGPDVEVVNFGEFGKTFDVQAEFFENIKVFVDRLDHSDDHHRRDDRKREKGNEQFLPNVNISELVTEMKSRFGKDNYYAKCIVVLDKNKAGLETFGVFCKYYDVIGKDKEGADCYWIKFGIDKEGVMRTCFPQTETKVNAKVEDVKNGIAR